jgi:bifunctional DNase/RNase
MESRPSDAFALVTRKKCPVLVATSVIENAGIPLDFFITDLEKDPYDKYSSIRKQLELAVAE